jgi:hypothetical protein
MLSLQPPLSDDHEADFLDWLAAQGIGPDDYTPDPEDLQPWWKD